MPDRAAPVIRPLTEADAADYRALRLLALETDPDAFTSSPEDEAGFTEAEIAARAAPEPPGATFGAFAGDTLVGMAGYAPERRVKTRHKATMVGVFLRPEWRGSGVGRRLVAAVVEHARAQRVVLRCNVRVGNGAARSLYLSFGFAPFGVEPAAIRVGETFFDDEMLALDLRGG